ncbi:MAG: 50S ribosomal protein L30e [Candidatus Methanogaster sp.]|nr:MAG: 50S ribosomal protein L30e [ANME-2 cluster archaeon]
MDIDLNKALGKTIRSGKVLIGSNVSRDAVKNNRGITVVLAANCPARMRAEILDSNASVIEYPGMGIDLGIACGKPFNVAALTILDPGDSGIMAIFEPEETPETSEISETLETLKISESVEAPAGIE